MRVDIVGGGPAGLMLSTTLRRHGVAEDVRVFERDDPGSATGWGVVFPEGALNRLSTVHPDLGEALHHAGVTWTPVQARVHRTRWTIEGNRFLGIPRDTLLRILRDDAVEHGVELTFGHRVTDPADHVGADLLVGADGINSVVRRRLEHRFRPRIEHGSFHYGWFGVELTLTSFTYLFVDTEWGLFQGYVYPSGDAWSSLIIYVSEATWIRSGLVDLDVDASLRLCERVFAEHLEGRPILRRGPTWSRFRHLRCASWHTDDVVLIGDAAHTAHFSIGSGTRLALEDALALTDELREERDDLPRALARYEQRRRDRVERVQDTARLSERYFDTVRRYLDFEPIQFAYQLVARSWRISFADIARRDPAFIRRFNGWFHSRATGTPTEVAPSPAFAPARIGATTLANRVVTTSRVPGAGLVIDTRVACAPDRGAAIRLPAERLAEELPRAADAGYTLGLLDLGAVTAARPRARLPHPAVAELRESWPDERPIGVVLAFADGCDSAANTADVVALARELVAGGVDVLLLEPTRDDPPAPGRVLQVADAARNDGGAAVVVDDHLGTLDALDTAVAAGRCDLGVLRFDPSDHREAR